MQNTKKYISVVKCISISSSVFITKNTLKRIFTKKIRWRDSEIGIDVWRQNRAFIDVDVDEIALCINNVPQVSLEMQNENELYDPDQIELISLCGFISESGILKLIYTFRLSKDFDETKYAVAHTMAIQSHEKNADLYLKIVEMLVRVGLIVDQGLVPRDFAPFLDGQSDNERLQFQRRMVTQAWHTTNFIELRPSASQLGAHIWPSITDGHSTCDGEIYRYGHLAFEFRPMLRENGRYGWTIVDNGDDDFALIRDLMHISTIPLEMRAIIDSVRSNILVFAKIVSLGELLSIDSISIRKYLSQFKVRLRMCEEYVPMIDTSFRKIFNYMSNYLDISQNSEMTKNDSDFLIVGLDAEAERQIRNLSRNATIVGLFFTTISLVSTAAAIIDFVDKDMAIFDINERIYVLIISCLTAIVGLMAILLFKRR